MSEFGENLRKAREKKGMTQQTLANQIYVTRQSISRWETGSRYPDLMTTKKISELLEVSIDDLLSGEKVRDNIEIQPFLDKKKNFFIQNLLYGLTFALTLAYTILFTYQILHMINSISIWEIYLCLRYIGGSILLGLLFFLSIQKELTPRKVGSLYSCGILLMMISEVIMFSRQLMLLNFVLNMLILLLSMTIIIAYYMLGTLKTSILVYMCFLFQFLMRFSSKIQGITMNGVGMQCVLLVILIMVYIVATYQTYLLDQKRKLAIHPLPVSSMLP